MASEFISSDIVSILLFVSPGFLTIGLIGKFFGMAIHMEQFEKTVWSLIASTPIGIMFIYLNDIDSIGSFLSYFISHPFISLIEIIVMSFVLAITTSLLLKYEILDKLSQWLIYNNSPSIQTDGTVWDRFLKKNFAKAVIVKANDMEYKGWLSSNSSYNEKREIVLDSPAIVHTFKDGTTQDFPCGLQMILFEDDIKSIIVLEN